MKNFRTLIMLIFPVLLGISTRAQTLDVSVLRVSVNKVQIIGTATGTGFGASPFNSWASMSITWRIPKTAAVPAPVASAPAASPDVTNEATAFTGSAPRDAFNATTDLSIFDMTSFMEPDDGFWYFQVTGTQETVQSIATGQQVILFEFNVPITWTCSGCVEILTTDIPVLMDNHNISTTSNIYNGGTGTDVLNVVVNNAPLPVVWAYVKAEPTNNRNILVSWSTASEQNNAGFEVERSEDGVVFQSIGKVNGNGNTSTPSYYAFNDSKVEAGVRYFYRIRQTDLDGRSRNSIIVNAILLSGNSFLVEVRPNPVRNILNLDIQASRKQTAQVVITDLAGKVYHIEKAVKLETTPVRYSTSVANYLPGIYMAKVIADDGTVKSVKFVVAR